MKLQRQPNNWSCVPTSFAIVINIPIEQILLEIGHDGSEIIWKDHPEPYNRRGFHIQELIKVCLNKKYAVTPIQPIYQSESPISYSDPIEYNEEDFENILKMNEGVLTGTKVVNGATHAVAWDKYRCFDPAGRISNINDFNIDCFWKINQIVPEYNFIKILDTN